MRRAEALKDREDLAAAEKATKSANKIAEKVRRDALTAAERRAEDHERREDTARRKAAKLLQAEEELARARVLIG